MRKKLLDKLHGGRDLDMSEAKIIGDVSSVDERVPLKYSYDIESEIESGAFANVYPIREGYKVVKIYKKSIPFYKDLADNRFDFIERSFRVQCQMRKKFGSLIPKPEGLFNVYCNNVEDFRLGLVMDRFPGSDLMKLEDKMPASFITPINKKAREIWYEMLGKGYHSFYEENGGVPWKNIIYNFGNDSFGFVDFDLDTVRFN